MGGMVPFCVLCRSSSALRAVGLWYCELQHCFLASLSAMIQSSECCQMMLSLADFLAEGLVSAV